MSKPIKLLPHEAKPLAFATPSARIARDGAILCVAFEIPGSTSAVLLPEPIPPLQTQVAPERRADRLWEHTCFEVFLRSAQETAYLEFNFSPSSEWAAYQFDDYRVGMRHAEGLVPAVIATAPQNRFELSAWIELPGWDEQAWHLNLAAVIEETSGHKSYWALAHPPKGPPDFHDPACFVLELPPPENP